MDGVTSCWKILRVSLQRLIVSNVLEKKRAVASRSESSPARKLLYTTREIEGECRSETLGTVVNTLLILLTIDNLGLVRVENISFFCP